MMAVKARTRPLARTKQVMVAVKVRKRPFIEAVKARMRPFMEAVKARKKTVHGGSKGQEEDRSWGQ